MPASQIHTQIQIGRSPVPVRLALKSEYTWQAALKFTSKRLELITDPDIFLMVESAIRGGISTVSSRLSNTNW